MEWNAFDFAPGEFVRRRGAPPPQTGRMTVKKLSALIAAGYGQGHFQRYKPWLRVTKRDFSPVSNVGHLPSGTLARAHHYRARAERDTIQVLNWLGAVDVREAYPAWPWKHRHPGFGLSGFERSPMQKGLLDVAKEIGIDHGNYPGTNIPYVATIDIMATWTISDQAYRVVAFENKPQEISHAPNPLLRAKERLALIQHYCRQANIHRVLVHADKLPRELIVNLDLIEPKINLREQIKIRKSSEYKFFLEQLLVDGYKRSPTEIILNHSQKHKIEIKSLWQMLRLVLWHQDMDHDLTLPYKSWMPLIHGGVKYKKSLLTDWLGVN